MWNKYTKNKCKYYTSSRYQKLGQISIKKRNDALTPVISAVLAALIVTSIVGSVLSWGVPYVENLRSKSLQENIGMQFKTVADDLDDLVHAYPGERKISNLAIEEGYLSVDGVRDRTVVLYSYDEEYEFVITSIEDGTVTVKMIQSPVGFEGFNESWIYWFDYGEYCFLAGTKILMADSSYKNIENVKIGEQVLSYDKHTGGVVSSKVVNVFHHSPEEMTEYYLVINEVLKVTPNHRFYSDGRWVYAGDLKIGDPLHPKEQNQDYIVYSIDRVYERDASFDLEVERCHNYFVSIGDDGVDVLVHNGDLPPIIDPPTVQTLSAWPVIYDTATLRGKIVDDGGEPCEVQFRYRILGKLAMWTYPSPWGGSYQTDDVFTEYISGLKPGADYEYQAGAKNSAEEDWDISQYFSISDQPAVVTEDATDISISQATLHGQILFDGGASCMINFRWKPRYGSEPWSYYGWTGEYYTNDPFNGIVYGLTPGEEYEYQAGAKNTVNEKQTWGDFKYFTTNASDLSVQTLPATDITPTTAKLHGKILNGGGEPCQIQFRWRRPCDSGPWIYSPEGWRGSYNTDDTFLEIITGLNSSKHQYDFQAGAKNSAGETWGETLHFTPIYSPTAYTSFAYDVTDTTATLLGVVGDPGGDTCQVRFRYAHMDPYDDLGAFTLADEKGLIDWWVYPSNWNGSYTIAEEPFWETITGLIKSTEYVFRAGVKNTAGEDWGDYKTFNTSDNYTASIQTLNATSITTTTATLNGKILNDGGEPCQIRFRYRLENDITWIYPSFRWHGSYHTNDTFSDIIIGLNRAETYEYQAGVKNIAGEIWSNPKYFTTELYEGIIARVPVTPIQIGESTSWLIEIPENVPEEPYHPMSFSGTTCIDLHVDGPCFLAGTKILMADSSYKNIENVKIGEQVLSYDKHTGGVVSSKIVNVFHHSPEEMTEYYLVINEVLKVTPNHRFYSDGRWVYAGDLKIGDPLHPKEQNQDYIVYSIDRVYERDASFDLEVERCHNYFVSIDDNNVDILVHNDDDRIGTIWIFDSNSLTYKKSFSMGTQETIMENGGIIHSEAGDSYVQKEPSVYASGDTFSIHALQTVAAAFSGSGTGDLKFRMYSNLYNSNIRETGQVYYLRLQFWGDHSDTWLSYYNNTYQFNDDPDPDASNSLLYTPSTNEGGVWFALANSIIRFSIR